MTAWQSILRLIGKGHPTGCLHHSWLLSHHYRLGHPVLLHTGEPYRLFEDVYQVGVVHAINEVGHDELIETLSFQVVLSEVEVETHGLNLGKKLELLVLEVLWHHAWLHSRRSQRHLGLQLPALFLGCWEGFDSVFLHVV